MPLLQLARGRLSIFTDSSSIDGTSEGRTWALTACAGDSAWCVDGGDGFWGGLSCLGHRLGV
jgi:hypothetical protein